MMSFSEKLLENSDTIDDFIITSLTGHKGYMGGKFTDMQGG